MKNSQNILNWNNSTIKNLLNELKQKKSDLIITKMNIGFNKIKNHTQAKMIKKQIAQIETIINEKIILESKHV